MLLAVLWAVWVARRERYGTLRYILTLEVRHV